MPLLNLRLRPHSEWTYFPPSADTQFAFVRPVANGGNDSTAVLSLTATTALTSPFATLNAASEALHAGGYSGTPYRLLAEDGSLFTGDATGTGLFRNNGHLQLPGRSVSEPGLIAGFTATGISNTNYRGTVRGVPPIIRATSNSLPVAGIITATNPGELDYLALQGLTLDANSQASMAAISVGQSLWFFAEDVVCLGGDASFESQTSGLSGQLILRRCKISQTLKIGTLIDSPGSATLDGCMWYQCGWDGVSARDTFSHNVYGQRRTTFGNILDQSAPESWLYKECESLYPSDTAFRMRQGGKVLNCYASAFQTGVEMGAGNEGVPAIPWQCEISDNVFQDGYDGANGALFIVVGNQGPQPLGIKVRRNIVSNVHAGQTSVGGIVVPAGASADVDASNVAINWGGREISAITATGNTIGSIITSTSGMPNPGFVLNDYATHLGYANEAALIAAKIANRQYNWDYRLTVPPQNNFIRAACGMATI